MVYSVLGVRGEGSGGVELDLFMVEGEIRFGRFVILGGNGCFFLGWRWGSRSRFEVFGFLFFSRGEIEVRVRVFFVFRFRVF